MTRITVDPELLSKLGGLSNLVELCDDAGRVVAQVWPVPNGSHVEYDPATPELSEEELDRIESSNERRYTTEQVREHLRNL